MSEDSNPKLTDFIVNKEEVQSQSHDHLVAPPEQKSIEKHVYKEISPAYQICKVCNKPEEADTHLPNNEMTQLSPQDYQMAQMAQQRPAIETSDVVYDDNPTTETPFKPPEFMQTQQEPTYSQTPETTIEDARATLQPKVEELDLTTAMRAVEDIVNSPTLTPENAAIAESLLNDIENIIEANES
jgi:hypothetical protein